MKNCRPIFFHMKNCYSDEVWRDNFSRDPIKNIVCKGKLYINHKILVFLNVFQLNHEWA